MMGQALAIAEVPAIVVSAANGLFVADAAQYRQTSCVECIIQWRSAANAIYGDALVHIDGFVDVETENVRVLSFDHRIWSEGPAVTEVEFFGYRVAVVGVEQTTGATWVQG